MGGFLRMKEGFLTQEYLILDPGVKSILNKSIKIVDIL
jgi:hypothetical protein